MALGLGPEALAFGQILLVVRAYPKRAREPERHHRSTGSAPTHDPTHVGGADVASGGRFRIYVEQPIAGGRRLVRIGANGGWLAGRLVALLSGLGRDDVLLLESRTLRKQTLVPGD